MIFPVEKSEEEVGDMTYDLPCFSQLDIGDTIIISKRYVQLPICIQWATIETDVFLERLEDECPFVDGGFCLSWHCYDGRTL